MSKLETVDGELHVDGKKVIKGWESFTGWYWFATEIEQGNYDGKPIWFGYVQGMYDEWGTFTQAELDEIEMIWEIRPDDLPHAGRRN